MVCHMKYLEHGVICTLHKVDNHEKNLTLSNNNIFS